MSVCLLRVHSGPNAAGVVYSPPSRGCRFDTDFLTATLLPPRTSMFRDINTLTFRRLLRPNQ